MRADMNLVSICNWNRQPPLAEYRSHGTGRLVAVIGDSMTAQMRDTLLNDERYDWYLLSRCATAIYSFDHPDPRATPGLPEAFAQLKALQPRALVVALGLTDLGGRLPYEGSMQWMLRETASIPCRSWANVYANPNIDPRIPGGQEAFEEFNATLERSLAGTDVHLLDWAYRAGAIEVNEQGYHPWLNPADWVHLLPGTGFDQRTALLTSDLGRCF